MSLLFIQSYLAGLTGHKFQPQLAKKKDESLPPGRKGFHFSLRCPRNLRREPRFALGMQLRCD
jgi:hypothetical protein